MLRIRSQEKGGVLGMQRIRLAAYSRSVAATAELTKKTVWLSTNESNDVLTENERLGAWRLIAAGQPS